MKKHFNLFSLFFLAASMIAFAQSSITGTVSDADGSPLPGATVVVQGTSSGVTTDFDGNYSINASSGDVLSFSYVGYQTVDITVGSSITINVTLTSDSALDEVIVTAYGTQTKQSIVGSVTSIGSEILEASKATSVTQAIQGSVPGVNIISSGGIPGSNPTIRIRGIGSINASASPLIVVDGAPYAGNLNSLSQDQVESISVLKDAAASIYGARAGNGVILVTTKRGSEKPEDAKFTYHGTTTWSSLVQMPKTVNAHQFAELMEETGLGAANELPGYLNYDTTRKKVVNSLTGLVLDKKGCPSSITWSASDNTKAKVAKILKIRIS